MKFQDLLLGAAAISTATALEPTKTRKHMKRASFKWVGVSESGAEFGSSAIPGELGKDYIWPEDSSIDVCSNPAVRACGGSSWDNENLILFTDFDGQGLQHLPHPIPHVSASHPGIPSVPLKERVC